ncbi:MAG TPA: hypothetical protein VNU72_14275 [Puia sp.]|nr:hypothetical protein [Puia sp.]
MKTLISLLTLVSIVLIYILSASLYVQGETVAAYVMVLASISSLVFWIKSNDFLQAIPRTA